MTRLFPDAKEYMWPQSLHLIMVADFASFSYTLLHLGHSMNVIPLCANSFLIICAEHFLYSSFVSTCSRSLSEISSLQIGHSSFVALASILSAESLFFL